MAIEFAANSSMKVEITAMDSELRSAQEALLWANSAAYERLAGIAESSARAGDIDRALNAVSRAAQFSSAFHPGRFADGAIENIAFRAGAALHLESQAPARQSDARSSRRVLHVISQVSNIGGHTRMLYHWVLNDRTSTHSIVLLRQGERPVPAWLTDGVRSVGGAITVCDSKSTPQTKAAILSRLARQEADLVVLHHDGDDIVPILAFASPGGPPVTVLNHADHAFWLGSSVADATIDLRSIASDHSRERRFSRPSAVLPIPLSDAPEPLPRHLARSQLGIPSDRRMLLTIGRQLKYRPCGHHDFLSTARKILERDRVAHLYVVGASEIDMAPYWRGPRHDRIHFLGAIEDPSAYRAAADVYMESFPFGSNTALLEAALAGLPVVPAYAPLFPLLVAGNDSLQGLISNPIDEEAYVQRVCDFAGDKSGRIEFGARLRERVLADHVGNGWLDRLEAVYRCTDALVHRPALLPSSQCQTLDADIGLSLWNVMSDGKTNFRAATSLDSVALFRHAAYVAKDTGDYATARQLSLRAILAGPTDRASWRLLGASALGQWGPVMRAWLRGTVPAMD